MGTEKEPIPPRLRRDWLVDEQEQLAAQEAAAIGGKAGDEEIDPAERPVREAGGGESEGFEIAEQDLIRNSTHADDHSDSIVIRDASTPEKESDRQTGEFGESDSVAKQRGTTSDEDS